jgi:S1-C subfamily serine protease
VRTTQDLSAALAELKPGDEVAINVAVSDGLPKTVRATVAEIPAG